MSTNLSDLQILTRDYIGQYSTGTVKDDRINRAINRAIPYIRRQVSFPSAERTHSFMYTTDQLYYEVPDNFAEAFYIKYNSDRMNEIYGAFEYFDYPQILENRKENRWSVVHHKGKPQILIRGSNGFGTTLLDSADSTDGWAVSNDASNLQIDTYKKEQGTASLSFDVTYSAGTATLTKTIDATDLRYIFDRSAFLKANIYLTETVDSLNLVVKSGASDYYTMTATLTDIGAAFPVNEWFKANFKVEEAVVTGTPDSQNITTYEFNWNLPSGFGPATEFRFDNFYVVFPEKLDMFYTTRMKGTDVDGLIEKEDLTEPTDLLMFSESDDDYGDLVAQRAALTLWPHIRGDMDAFVMLRQDFQLNMKGFTKQYPRRRVQGSFKHTLRR